ncbi:hypothetical protein F511_17020 [Dorcoceras hygrometricum]|uniref:Uncharacterized protein n=1 Tax=Dorcoceras hygrometricum TaxID=472368 RepID=A0A2Z7DCD6_9LAMI|nr:hypothetical protein F511_17020 [Dorcoceras hygrometricum]
MALQENAMPYCVFRLDASERNLFSGVIRCQRWSTVLCRTVRFDDFRCDQDLRSVRGVCCENGLRCYVVLISKSDVILIKYFRTLYSLPSSPITLNWYCSSKPYFRRLPLFFAAVGSKTGSAELVFSRDFD